MFSSVRIISRKKFFRIAAGLITGALAPAAWKTQLTAKSAERTAADKFADRILSDTATAMLSFGAFIGDRLGIYKALADAQSSTAAELAARTRLNERYMQEWLALMATAGYVQYDPQTSRYRLPRAHATVLCDGNSRLFMAGYLESLACVFPAYKVMEGFRGGKGPVSEDYPPEHWEGIERSTAPSYRNFLTQEYIPAMPEIMRRLQRGGAALDLGCGAGIASVAIAKAYPKAEVFGLDVFTPSIEKARKNASSAGLGSRIQFDTYDGVHLPENRFDLITICYSVHHFTDPVEVLGSVRKALRDGGSLVIMEANIPEKLENSIGHTWANWNYGVSLFYCMSAALTDGAPGYGAAIKGSQIETLGRKAGFRRFRRIPVENPFDALYQLNS